MTQKEIDELYSTVRALIKYYGGYLIVTKLGHSFSVTGIGEDKKELIDEVRFKDKKGCKLDFIHYKTMKDGSVWDVHKDHPYPEERLALLQDMVKVYVEKYGEDKLNEIRRAA